MTKHAIQNLVCHCIASCNIQFLARGELFLPTSDQQLLSCYVELGSRRGRLACSRCTVPPPVSARGCPPCNKWPHRFYRISTDFHRFLERLPSGQCATSSHPLILHMFVHQQWRGLKKENNLWNKWEVTKWPIINCCYFLCFCFEEIIIKVDVGLKDISIIPMMHNHPKQHELIR